MASGDPGSFTVLLVPLPASNSSASCAGPECTTATVDGSAVLSGVTAWPFLVMR